MEKTEARKALLVKLNGFRKELAKLDWSDDKAFAIGGSVKYKYVSADRVKENFGPLVYKHGLEMRIDFDQLEQRGEIGNMTQHWTLRGTLVLTDIDTGESESFMAYGEAGDSGDKGINKAQTDALKQIIFNSFMVADGIDPDGEGIETTKPARVSRSFDKEDQEVAKSKALEQGVKPAAKPIVPKPKASVPKPAPKPAVEPAEAPAEPAEKPEEPKPKAAVRPKVAVKPKAKVMPKPKSAPIKDNDEFPPSAVQKKAMERILKNAWREVEDGTMQAADYDILESDIEKIETSEQARAFMEAHKR